MHEYIDQCHRYKQDPAGCPYVKFPFHGTNLQKLGANVTWSEATGVHNWNCFGVILKEMINWITQ